MKEPRETCDGAPDVSTKWWMRRLILDQFLARGVRIRSQIVDCLQWSRSFAIALPLRLIKQVVFPGVLQERIQAVELVGRLKRAGIGKGFKHDKSSRVSNADVLRQIEHRQQRIDPQQCVA